MRFKRLIASSTLAAVAVGMLLVASPARAQQATLKVGDAAPPLKVGKWVKGEPISSFQPGTVYVMEFWATWCGPCIAAIPHVTELQKKHEGKVVMIGQNVWERDDTKVEPFVQKMGEKMGYRVVMDDKSEDKQGAMATTWMQAAGQNGIPCSMIVDQQGKIAWIGHPMAMEPVLAKVVEGKYEPKAEAGESEAAPTAQQQKMAAFQKKMQAAMVAKDADAAMSAVDELVAGNETMTKQAPVGKFQILLQMGQYDKAYAMGDQVFETIKDNKEALNQFAWIIATEEKIAKRDLKFAQRLAERGVELTENKDPAVIDTLARIHFDQGGVDEAIKLQTKATELAPAEEKAEYTKTLEKYQAAKK